MSNRTFDINKYSQELSIPPAKHCVVAGVGSSSAPRLSNDDIGSAIRHKRLISAARFGFAKMRDVYIDDPFSQAMLSRSLSSIELRCLFNSRGRVSSCLTKYSITLLKSKAVIPAGSKTAGKVMVTVLCVARTSSAEQAIMQRWNRSLERREVRLLFCSLCASDRHMAPMTL